MRYDLRDGFAVSTNNEGLTFLFNFQQNGRQLRLGLVDI
jgi:hypothetical protein